LKTELVDRNTLPHVDVQGMLNPPSGAYIPPADLNTVSVEVLAIVSTAATSFPITKDSDIFYDNDVLAIVRRAKSRASGLVSTTVWGWQGRRAQLGGKEERRLAELAKRYGTSLIRVAQGAEPPEMVHALGGRLALRQGSRTHWSAENTAMHLIRLASGCVFIDEHDLVGNCLLVRLVTDTLIKSCIERRKPLLCVQLCCHDP
jgi:hypothetical protein